MPRRQFNDGQEIIQGDLNAIPSSLEIELYDRLIYELMGRQQSVVFGDSFLCSNVNATTSQVKLGNGIYYDSTQVDPEPKNRLLYESANNNVSHAAADATNNRIDIICITPARATASSSNRNFKDAGTGVISSVSMVVETDWLGTLSVVTGTPSGSPAVPATPAGAIKLAEVLVTAVTGISGAGAYTDKRPRYSRNKRSVKTTLTSNTTLDLDDEVVPCNAVGGAFAVTLPSAALMAGRSIVLYKTDVSANAVTVTAAGADLIIGSATQLMSVQWTLLELFCDGTNWLLA